MEQTFKLIERPSEQIKELRLLYEQTENLGIYKVFSEWPGYPYLNSYIRFLYDSKNPDVICGLDFDGGPLIHPGYKLDEHYTIKNIYRRDKITYEFLVEVEKTD